MQIGAAGALRAARRAAGLGLRALARRADTSHATLLAYESGAKAPRLDTLQRVVRAAGYSLELALVALGDDGSDRRGKGDRIAAALQSSEDAVAKLHALHDHLDAAGIPHAFGGALALGWCVAQPRSTSDIDLNVFAPPHQADEAFSQMPDGVAWSADDIVQVLRTGQVRLWWGPTPIDVFFMTTDLHREAALRIRREPLAGREVWFLSCRDVGVLKALQGGRGVWADLGEMASAGTLDLDAALGAVVRTRGGGDPRVARLRALDPTTDLERGRRRSAGSLHNP